MGQNDLRERVKASKLRVSPLQPDLIPMDQDHLRQVTMGPIFAEIELSNPRQVEFDPIQVKALVDTGALMLCIPEHIANQLNLETESMREVSVADGRSTKVP